MSFSFPLRGNPRSSVSLTLIAVLLLGTIAAKGVGASEKPSILLLNAYHQGLAWTDDLTSSVAETLREHHLYVEYMDAQRFVDKSYLELLRSLLFTKYMSIDIDVVISSDDQALDFLLHHREHLFPNVPIVFCGINNFSPARLAGHRQVTGVVAAFDVQATLELALALHPSADTVVLIKDTANRQVIEQLQSELDQRVVLEVWENLSLPDLLTRLPQLSEKTVVLMISLNHGTAGKGRDDTKNITQVVQQCPAPVYGVRELHLGCGIVGGKLISGRTQGYIAAGIAKAIVGGTPAEDIPVVTDSPNRWMFDDHQLVRFDIDTSRLPDNSAIINRKTSAYQQYKVVIWGAASTILALAILAIVLLVTIEKGRNAKDALRASQRFLENLTGNLPAVVYQFYATADGRYGFTYVSHKIVDVFGIAADPETLVENFSACVAREDKNRFFDSIDEAVKRNQPWHFEGRFVRPSGDTIWFSGSSMPRKEGGNLVFDGVLTDISTLKNTEEKLRQSEQQMAQIINFLPDPTFVIDRSGQVIAWNRAMEELTGVEANNMLGKGDYEYAQLFYGERRPIMIDLVADWNAETAATYSGVRKKGSVLISETKESHRPFGDRYFKNTAGPLYDAQGTLIGAIETVHDVTDSKKAEEEATTRKLFLESVLYHAPDAVIILNAEQQVTDWNPGAEIIFGYTREEALGQKLDELVIDDSIRAEAEQQTRQVIEGNRVEAFETVRYRKDGRPVNVIAAGSPIMVADTLTAVVVMYTDITILKQAEEEVRRNERMLRRIIDIVPSMIFVRNAEGRFLMANQAVAESYDMPAESLVGKHLHEVHPDRGQAQRFLTDDRKAFATGQPLFIPEEPFLDNLGTLRWLEVIKLPCDAHDFGEPAIVSLATDITDRRAAERRLQESEKQYRTLFENTGTGTVLSEADTTLSTVNQEFAAMVGYSREEIEGRMSWTQFIIPEDVERMKIYHDMRRKDPDSAPSQWECGIIDRQGIVKPMLLKVRLIPGTQTSVGAFLDISDRKQAEEAILKANRMLRLVLDTIPVRVFWKDQEGRYLGCNQAFAQDAGLTSPDDLIGKEEAFPWADDQTDAHHHDDRTVMASGRARINYEKARSAPDGQIIWLQTSTVPIRDGAGHVIGVLGTYMDITTRKQNEEEIHRLRNYLANIIDSMPSILIGVDAQGRVTQWNRKAERVTGITFNEAQFQPLQSVFPRFAKAMAHINQAIRNREIIRNPKMAHHEDGETRFEEVTVFPLITNGVDGAVVRLDDITDRVRLEEMMIQSEKMLSVGGLAAGMAHEINNPLAGVLQNTAVLENRLFGDLPANHKAAENAGTTMATIQHYLELRRLSQMVENIRLSGKRAAAIVKNMLSFARKSEHVVSSHDLRKLLDQTIELVQTDYDMKKRYDFKQIAIQREYDDTAGPVPCESSKIQQVFLNILKNGAEAMTERATEIPTPAFTLRVVDEGVWVRVEIEDNGPGMPEKTRRRIFEPFFTTKEVGRGTGLGLSVSYFIITENHGGKMRVESGPGKGTRFIIRLPKTQTA